MRENNNYIINDELITSFLLKETSEAENAIIKNWLDETPENKKILQKHRNIIDMVALLNQNVDAEWQKFKHKLTPQAKKVSIYTKKTKIIFLKWAVAASITLLIGISAYFAIFSNLLSKNIVAKSKENVVNIVLNDGSHVTLNRQSVIKYPKKFTDDKRLVKLQGEAHFNVTPDKEKPFIVEAENLTVTVLGTSFYVRSFSGQPQQVYVESGKVECVHKTTSENIVLNSGESYVFGSQKQTPEVVSDKDMNTFAWKTTKLIFVNEKLSDIIALINNAYNSKINIKGPVANCRLTVSFENLSIDGIINVLQTILDVRISKSDKQIVISGEGC